MNSKTLTLGEFSLTIVSGGMLRIDGGSMFGIIPQMMWKRYFPPDEQNRIQLDTNCLLVRNGTTTGLIDTGYGDKADDKSRKRLDLASDHALLRHLQDVGVAAEDIDWVVLTHLHFDHAGGGTRRDSDGQLQPTFPNAAYYVHESEWEDASSGDRIFAGAYSKDDFAPLHTTGQLRLIGDEREIVPGVSTFLTEGHTRGHLSVRLSSQGATAFYLADLAPTTAHLRTVWSPSYDQFPLTIRRTKQRWLSEIADAGDTAILCHDPNICFTRLQIDSRGDAVTEIDSVRPQ